jgi:hypothetical protein
MPQAKIVQKLLAKTSTDFAMNRRSFSLSVIASCVALFFPRSLWPANTSSAVTARAAGERVVPTKLSEASDKTVRGKSAKSVMTFENATDTSKIAFTLTNSVSPQRYSIETMMGGVAAFDFNNDGPESIT